MIAARFKLGLVFLMAVLMAACSSAPAETVLVAGATGRTGSAIREVLRAEGYEIIALTRDAVRAAEQHGEDWAWVEADVRDAAAVTRAIEGADFVISALGARNTDGPDGPEFVDYGGVKNLSEAARDNGVKHFVLISSGAAGPYRERSTMIRRGRVRYWKTQGENAVKLSGVPYTVIGPGGLEELPASGDGLRVMHRRDYDTGAIAIGDVAMLAVNALKDPNARNKTFAAIRDLTVARDAWRDMLAALPEDTLTEEWPTPNPATQ